MEFNDERPESIGYRYRSADGGKIQVGVRGLYFKNEGYVDVRVLENLSDTKLAHFRLDSVEVFELIDSLIQSAVWSMGTEPLKQYLSKNWPALVSSSEEAESASEAPEIATGYPTPVNVVRASQGLPVASEGAFSALLRQALREMIAEELENIVKKENRS